MKVLSRMCPQQVVRECSALFFSLCFPYDGPRGTGTAQLHSNPSLPGTPAALSGRRQPGGEAGRVLSCSSGYSVAALLSSHIKQLNHTDKLSQTCGCHNTSK